MKKLDSREFKLMLNVDRFTDRERGIHSFWTLIEFMVKRLGGDTEPLHKEMRSRRVWFIDTPNFGLRKAGWVLRYRVEGGQRKVTLKFRNPDRYIVAERDLRATVKAEDKFEQDIVPRFASKFSQSASIKKKINFEHMDDLYKIFPNTGIDIRKEAPLKVVNQFKASETILDIGKIVLPNFPKVKARFTFWNFANDVPLLSEFSWGYQVEDERFPVEGVMILNKLFASLQRSADWLSLITPTKTAYAYEVF